MRAAQLKDTASTGKAAQYRDADGSAVGFRQVRAAARSHFSDREERGALYLALLLCYPGLLCALSSMGACKARGGMCPGGCSTKLLLVINWCSSPTRPPR